MKKRAIGVTCGIGSMLHGAKQAGFEIQGNIEWRRYYHARDPNGQNTFKENFPGAFMKHKLEHLVSDEIERAMGVELAMGHPECGQFSTLAAKLKDLTNPGDIPLFVDLIAELKPRFFVMDDLPKSLIAYPMQAYHEKLKDYDLYPEWVSNWNYGNIQKGRKRFFMIGARREEEWAFVPGEEPNLQTLGELIGDLSNPQIRGNTPNHAPHAQWTKSGIFVADPNGKDGRRHATWAEVEGLMNEISHGKAIYWRAKDGTMKPKLGVFRSSADRPAYVITGGINSAFHWTGRPFTIRERARIQGFSDEFVFYGEKMEQDGTWSISRNSHMIKQTGKAMPVQFCRYAAEQIGAHLDGVTWQATGERLLKPNEYITEAKRWYCQNVGYTNQERACGVCWLRDKCDIRKRMMGGWRPGMLSEPSYVQAQKEITGFIREAVELIEPINAEPYPPAADPAPAQVRRSLESVVKEPTVETQGGDLMPGVGKIKAKPGVRIGEFLKFLVMMGRFTPDQIVMIARENYPESKCSTQDVSMARRRIREAGGVPPLVKKSA